MDDEVPASYAEILQKVAGLLRDRDKARQINDRQQQRAWRHLAQERLEQLVNELFLNELFLEYRSQSTTRRRLPGTC
jgi:hypothetical protein